MLIYSIMIDITILRYGTMISIIYLSRWCDICICMLQSFSISSGHVLRATAPCCQGCFAFCQQGYQLDGNVSLMQCADVPWRMELLQVSLTATDSWLLYSHVVL